MDMNISVLEKFLDPKKLDSWKYQLVWIILQKKVLKNQTNIRLVYNS